MALVHEKLYQSTNLSRIDFGDYIRALGELLFRSSAINPANVVFEVAGSEIFLSIETAVPCGLVVNELLSNALKHAFPSGRGGSIRVQLDKQDDGSIALRLRDDGIGLPPAFDLDRTETLGLRLVQGLVQQIDGTIIIERPEAGAAFSVVFPAERGR
jgi:two-component sensor histidine kinase